VCGGDCLTLFRADELELLICGSPTLDFHALQGACRYEDGFTRDSALMGQLWEVLHALPEADKKKFLMFATGR
jgi:ubiquitin-protein ligase E3 A